MEGVKALAKHLPSCPSLQSFTLVCSRLGQEGLRVLSEARAACPNIRAFVFIVSVGPARRPTRGTD